MEDKTRHITLSNAIFSVILLHLFIAARAQLRIKVDVEIARVLPTIQVAYRRRDGWVRKQSYIKVTLCQIRCILVEAIDLDPLSFLFLI